MCPKDINYNLSGLFVFFLCTMQSVCVNDASFKRKMLQLKGFFLVISQKRIFLAWKVDWAEAWQIFTIDTSTANASCRSPDRNDVTRPRVTSTFVSSERSQLSQVSGTFPGSGAQRRAEGCAPANPPTDALYTMLTQWSCMAAVVFFSFFSCGEWGGQCSVVVQMP